MKDNPKDPRSTGRKRGRAVLQGVGRPYWCRSTQNGGVNEEFISGIRVGCGRSPTIKDAPGGYYPGMAQLQVNHINKNILDNDPVNLEWVCTACHKYLDRQTAPGVSIKGDEFGYGMLGVTVVDEEE